MMISSQLLSTVPVFLLIHSFFWFPVLPCIALKVDWTGNPLQSISTGNTHALYHLLHLPDLVLRFLSLVGLLASLFQWDNYPTRMTILHNWDQNVMSDAEMMSGKTVVVTQSLPASPKKLLNLGWISFSRYFLTDVLDWPPSLTKLMNFISFFSVSSSFVPSLVHLQALKILVHASVCVCPVLKRHCKMIRHVLECLLFHKAYISYLL